MPDGKRRPAPATCDSDTASPYAGAPATRRSPVSFAQTAYFVADPAGATALRVWNGDGDQVGLRAGSAAARFNAVEDGRLVFQTPEIEDFESIRMCRELREFRGKVEMGRLMDACRKRAPGEECRLCLGTGER